MAKLSSINKNNRRIKLSNKFYKKRKKLKNIIMNKKLPLEERFKAQIKLSNLLQLNIFPSNNMSTKLFLNCSNEMILIVLSRPQCYL